jgi:hypothetical protein
VRPLHRRRLALALVAFAWLAQQLGFAAHGPMQVGAALGGPLAEICTSAGLAPATGDPASPGGHRTQGPSLCDLYAATAVPVPASTPPLGFLGAVRGQVNLPTRTAAVAHDFARRAHPSRAPPLLLS